MASYAAYYGIVLPALGDVRSATQYGWAGTELTGTLIVGGATYTSAANVRFGTDRGDGTIGTLRVPTVSQTLAGVLVDASTGNVVLPSVGDVEASVTFGAASALVGTFAKPTVGQVQSGVGFGASGTEFVGTYAGGGLDAAGIRAAIGLSAANIEAQIVAIATELGKVPRAAAAKAAGAPVTRTKGSETSTAIVETLS